MLLFFIIFSILLQVCHCQQYWRVERQRTLGGATCGHFNYGDWTQGSCDDNSAWGGNVYVLCTNGCENSRIYNRQDCARKVYHDSSCSPYFMTWTDSHVENVGKFGVCSCVHKDAYGGVIDSDTIWNYAGKNNFINLYRVQYHPTMAPTSPTVSPVQSTTVPSAGPSVKPTRSPSTGPSVAPSVFPSNFPSVAPSFEPSVKPTRSPSVGPTLVPSAFPSNVPSVPPSHNPTTAIPSAGPSTTPTSTFPSTAPSYTPSTKPSKFPTDSPTWSEDHNVVPERFYTNNLYTDVVQDEASKASFLEQCTTSMKDYKLECYDIQENTIRGGKATLLFEGLPNAIEAMRKEFEFSGIKIGEYPLFVPYAQDSSSESDDDSAETTESLHPSVSPSINFPTSSPSISTSIQPNHHEVVLDLECSGLTEDKKEEALDAITQALLSLFEVDQGVASVVSHNLEGVVMENEALVRMKFHVFTKQEAADLNARIRETSDEAIIDEAALGLLDAFVFGVEVEAVTKPFTQAPASQSSSNSGTHWAIIIVSLVILFICAILFFWYYYRKQEPQTKDLENQMHSKRKPLGEVLDIDCSRNYSGANTFLKQNDTPKLHASGLSE